MAPRSGGPTALALPLLLLLLVGRSTSFHDLAPYARTHGSVLNHRQVRECQPVRFGNLTYEHHEAHRPESDRTDADAVATVRTFLLSLPSPLPKIVKGHFALVDDPLRTTTVLEPMAPDGCRQHQRGTVAMSARQRKCIVAMNVGFFNTTTSACLGNIVSDGRFVQNSGGIQNAQFGIKKNGSLFFGYISKEELESSAEEFLQLVSGVIWLVRNGTVYVEHSMQSECPDSQETGSFQRFVNVQSARTAVGHDKEGRLILMHVDGKTDQEGVNLWELAKLMQRFGAINAINTDGGGSATFVWNGVVVNYPSDDCDDQSDLKCARNVSTVLCIHAPECEGGCGRHGECRRGRCVCEAPWSGTGCSELPCHRHNCSAHGSCTEHGCICNHGWTGEACDVGCVANQPRLNCSSCSSRVNPDHGDDSICQCKNFTDSHNSSCCFQLQGNQPTLVHLKYKQYRLWLAATIVSACIAVIGIVTSTALLCSKRGRSGYRYVRNRRRFLNSGAGLDLSSSTDEEDNMLQQSK